jgi:4-aminobutyrate aminotransferase
VCCAAALATLELVQNGLMANAATVGDYFMAKLRELQARHQVIGEVRGRGLMIGMELVTDRASKAAAKELCDKIVDRAYYNGLLLLACGKSTLRFMPPLSVTRAEVDEAIAILEQTINECTAAPTRAGAQAR